MSHIIRLRKYTKLRIHNQIQVKDFKEIETLTISQQINLANYCGGEKILSPPWFHHCGGERPRCLRRSDAYGSWTPHWGTVCPQSPCFVPLQNIFLAMPQVGRV